MTIQGVSQASPLYSGWANVKVGDTVVFNAALTTDDKKIVASVGEKIDGSSPKVPHLAVAIALARQDGSLVGPVTEKFLGSAANLSSISSSIIQKAKEYLISSDLNQQQSSGHTVSYSA